MENSNVISQFVGISKRDKRLENRKRKAEAFLELLQNSQSRSRKKNRNSLPASAEEGGGDDVHLPTEESYNLDENENSAKNCSTSDHVAKESQNTSKLQAELKKIEKHRQKRERLKVMKRKIKQILKEDSLESPKFHLALKELALKQCWHGQKEDELPPLYMLDLQHLLMLALVPDSYIYYPRWCKLVRPKKVSSVVVININRLSSEDLEEHQECFPFMKKTFHSFVEVISPLQYGCTPMEDLFFVPVSKRSIKNNGALRKEQNILLKGQEKTTESDEPPTSPEPETVTVDTSDSTFDRQWLLLNPIQMMQEGYPMPVETQKGRYKDFIFSFSNYKPVTSDSPMYAIDCEMCLTSIYKHELTRISVVNEKLETVYDTLVKPYNKIINYLTQYSGITKKMLDPIKTRLPEVRRKLRQLLPANSIWVGQSLCHDLTAIKVFHPYVIDTSVIFNLSGDRYKKPGLKLLMKYFLNKNIQCGSDGHDSVEDARGAMELVQLKLEKGPKFGDVTVPDLENADSASGKDIATSAKETAAGVKQDASSVKEAAESEVQDKHNLFFRNSTNTTNYSLFSLIDKEKLSAALIDREELLSVYGGLPGVTCVGKASDRDRVKETLNVVSKHKLVWVQLHGLENFDQSVTSSSRDSDSESSEETEDSVTEESSDEDEAGELVLESDQKQEESLEEGEVPENLEMKKCLRRMDKRIKKIMKSVRPKSLVCVVLTGQSQPVRSGGVFITVT